MVFVLSIEVGMAGTSIDICLDAKAFDLTGPSAFGSLGCYLISGTYPCIWLQYELHIYIYISPSELGRSHIEIQKIKNVEKTKVIAFEAFWDPCRPSGSY